MTGPGGSILVADADGKARAALAGPLRAAHHTVLVAATIDEVLEAVAGSAPDLLVADARLSGGDGVSLLAAVRRVDSDVAVVVLVPVGQTDCALAAMGSGAADYLVKPVDPGELLLVVVRELERRRLRRETTAARARLAERYRFPDVIGDAPAMQRLFKAMVEVAALPAAALIEGEPGTGKALIAAALHQRSVRGRAPLVRTPPEAFEAASCQAARGGCLLVEEIADLTPAGQRDLVQVLEGPAGPAAASRPQPIDVRILAVTSRDLQAEIARGRFRKDLADRLRDLQLHVPPLRERVSDVPALASHFLERYAAAAGKAVVGIDGDALAQLRAYAWPGNVRELEGVIERAVGLASGPRLTAADLPPELRLGPSASDIRIPGWTLEQLERHAILETMKATGGSTGQTARLLGISVRNVQYKLRHYRAELGTSDLRPGRGGDEKVA